MAKKAVIVWGGWEGHEPRQCVDIFAPILTGEGYEVTVSDDLDTYKDQDLMPVSYTHLTLPTTPYV